MTAPEDLDLDDVEAREVDLEDDPLPRRREAKPASAPGGGLPARGLARPHGTPRPRGPKPPANLQALTGHDVELRTLSGGCYRGELIAVTPEWALLERRTGRLALIRLAAVAAACDENFPGGT